jgi:hypothetical protein
MLCSGWIASHFPRAVALVLGHALLWLVFEDRNAARDDKYLQEELSDQVWLAY